MSQVYNHQQSTGVRLGVNVESSRSLILFMVRSILVHLTALLLSIRNVQLCDWPYRLPVPEDYSSARQHPSLPLHSARFFRHVFEL
jgi:hypothetical protein